MSNDCVRCPGAHPWWPRVATLKEMKERPRIAEDIRARLIEPLLVVAGASLVHQALAAVLGEVAPLLLFVLGVLLAGWRGGLWPGLVATVLAAAVQSYAAFPPLYSLRIERPIDQIRLLLFVCVGIACSLVCEAARRSARRQRLVAQRLESLVQATAQSVWATDPSGAAVEDAPSWRAFTGQTREAWLQSGWLGALHPDDRETAAQAWAAARADRRVFEIECRVLRHDGQLRWSAIRAVPVLQADGSVREWVGMSADVTERKRTQQALRASEEQMTAVFHSTSVGVAVLTAEARFVQVNDAFCQLVGYPREALLATDCAALTHPEDAARSQELIASLLTGEIPSFVVEKRYIHKEGRVLWVRDSVSLAGDLAGKPPHLVALSQDVTLEKQVTLDRERLLAQRQLVLDAARLGWWHYDLSTRIASYDERYREIYGLTGDQQSVDDISPLLHPEDRPRVWAAVEAALDPADPQPYMVQYRVNRQDGTMRWVEARGLATFEGAGAQRKPTSFVGSVADVTERLLADQALQQRTAELESLLTSAPLAVAFFDRQHRYVRVNEALAAINGIPAADHLGRTVAQLLPANAVTVDPVIDRVFETGQPVSDLEVTGETPAQPGVRRHWLSGFYPVRDTQGAVQAVGAWIIEITDRKRAEEALREADRRKDEFLATLAHELRNPLAPLRNGLTLLRLAPGQAAGTVQIREMMERQLGHLVRLVDELLDVSRVSRGMVELKRERVTLATIVNSAVETSRPLLESQGHELVVSLPEETLWLEVDLTRMSQVLANLLNNAAKYTPAGGRVTLTGAREGDRVTLRVSDTGVGIPADMLPRVFDLFTQVGRSRDRAQGGLGIGLALVQKLVELHGGTIRAESPGPGQGSTFTLTLSLAADGGTRASAQAAGEGRAVDRRRVLIVDDNIDGAESLSLLLSMLGHETRTAHDGPQALVAAGQFLPDIAFLDIGMPGMSGYEVARALRAEPRLQKVVLVALTGWGSEADKRRSWEAGFDFHLTKPVAVEQVEALLAQLRGAT
jgi:PAS domain S-box-containing protein